MWLTICTRVLIYQFIKYLLGLSCHFCSTEFNSLLLLVFLQSLGVQCGRSLAEIPFRIQIINQISHTITLTYACLLQSFYLPHHTPVHSTCTSQLMSSHLVSYFQRPFLTMYQQINQMNAKVKMAYVEHGITTVQVNDSLTLYQLPVDNKSSKKSILIFF